MGSRGKKTKTKGALSNKSGKPFLYSSTDRSHKPGSADVLDPSIFFEEKKQWQMYSTELKMLQLLSNTILE